MRFIGVALRETSLLLLLMHWDIAIMRQVCSCSYALTASNDDARHQVELIIMATISQVTCDV